MIVFLYSPWLNDKCQETKIYLCVGYCMRQFKNFGESSLIGVFLMTWFEISSRK